MTKLGGPRSVRRIRLVVSAALLTGSLAACTADDDGQPPSVAAAALAAGLSEGRLDADLFEGASGRDPQRAWKETVTGMTGAHVEVSVGEVTEGEDGETATAELAYAWDLPRSEQTWTVAGTARLVRVEPDAGEATWKVRLEPGLFGLEAGETLDLRQELPARAPILGAGGVEIVKDRPVIRFGIDKAQIDKTAQLDAARALAAIVGVDPEPFAEQVEAAGDQAFVEAIVLREEEAGDALAAVAGKPGMGALSDTLPLAPTREFARPLLGSVGPVTAEIVKQSDGAYTAGDEAGLSGLQARYDEQLRGTPGHRVVAIKGERERTLFASDPEPGTPLVTTLDADLQGAAEQILSGVGPPAALVALRPSTGAILAAASGTGSEGYSTATLGQYAPGSTFKAVTSLALLRAGLTPGSPVSCPPSTVVDGKRFENYDDYPAGGNGQISFADAVANSCNTAFIDARDRVDDLTGAAASLGLGVDHDLGFPAYFGQVPEPESETSRAAAMIGQGQVLASPLTMAAVAASVATGRTVIPQLLPEQTPDQVGPGEPLPRDEATALRGLLRGVVTRGSGAGLADVPGPPVLAKTGTAEFGDADPLQTHAWMIAAQGDLAVAAFVEVGQSGSQTAGPLLEQLLRAARAG